jgi:PAS domain S-box-containing protein
VLAGRRAKAVAEGRYPVRWTGTQAIVTLPERIGQSDGGELRDDLLSLVDRKPGVLVADLTATVSCGQAGVAALYEAYQRASGNGTRMRVAVRASDVREALEAAGLDRLVAIYPSVQAAAATGAGDDVVPLLPRDASQPGHAADPAEAARWPARRRADPAAAGISPAVLWNMINALSDGVVLADDTGTLVLANRRAEDLFGYSRGELAGQQIEALVPGRLRAAHESQRNGYRLEPTARLMGERARLAGLRKDGSTFPVRISLSPVRTATGHYTMAVIRDISGDQSYSDLAELARAAAAAQDAHQGRELLNDVVNGLLRVGLSLQSAAEHPAEVAVRQIGEALRVVDEIIADIRSYIFAGPSSGDGAHKGPPGEP